MKNIRKLALIALLGAGGLMAAAPSLTLTPVYAASGYTSAHEAELKSAHGRLLAAHEAEVDAVVLASKPKGGGAYDFNTDGADLGLGGGETGVSLKAAVDGAVAALSAASKAVDDTHTGGDRGQPRIDPSQPNGVDASAYAGLLKAEKAARRALQSATELYNAQKKRMDEANAPKAAKDRPTADAEVYAAHPHKKAAEALSALAREHGVLNGSNQKLNAILNAVTQLGSELSNDPTTEALGDLFVDLIAGTPVTVQQVVAALPKAADPLRKFTQADLDREVGAVQRQDPLRVFTQADLDAAFDRGTKGQPKPKAADLSGAKKAAGEQPQPQAKAW